MWSVSEDSINMIHDVHTDKIVSVTTYIASASAVILGFTLNELAAIVGIIVALVTLVVNIWFKWQHLKLAKKKLYIDEEDLKELDNDN